MDILANIYSKSLAENEKNVRFWENYLKDLKALDFSVFSDKLKVPILVPIGSRILFRGELKHTNEVTVALGADYFAKCSVKQAEILRHHRIKGAQEKLDTFRKEQDYLQNQLTFGKKNVYEEAGQEIIEESTEEEERIWMEKHRENVRKYYKEGKHKEELEQGKYVTDEELWNRLEELELQEELENEQANTQIDNTPISYEPFIIKEHKGFKNVGPLSNQNLTNEESIEVEERIGFTVSDTPKHTSKFELLQQVMEKQRTLEQNVTIINYTEGQERGEKALIAKLDELDQIYEMEEEIHRLDDLLETEDIEEEDEEESQDEESSSPTKSIKSVSFSDLQDSETIEITFKHSDIEPHIEPYNPDKGITNPSDIYTAYPELFIKTPTTILKKTKYPIEEDNIEVQPVEIEMKVSNKSVDDRELIVVKDIAEKDADNAGVSKEIKAKPVSLFKQRRQQRKKK